MFLRRKAYQWHRLLSAVATIPLTMWAGSAILHQVNAWVRPEFSKAAYAMHIAGNDLTRAKVLVKELYRPDARIERIEKIEKFSHHYSAKNKVLPVFEASVSSSDDTKLYVDLAGRKIVSGSNQNSRSIHKWFGYLHKWDFFKPWPVLKAGAVILFSFITLLAGWLGVYVYFLLPWFSKKRLITASQKEKFWHRRIGICVSLFMMLFALTGLTHALSDLYPAVESFAKPFFNQLHLYRFTEGLGQEFRFWWLFILASSFMVLIFSGVILLLRVYSRRLYR